MYCFHCGAPMPEGAEACPNCGQAFLTPEGYKRDDILYDEVDEMEPPKRHPYRVPVLIMAGLFLAGLICFRLFPFAAPLPDSNDIPSAQKPGTSETQPNPEAPTQPNIQSAGASLRSEDFVPAKENCFEIHDGAIRFLSENYDGGNVLVIPNEIGGVKVTAIEAYGFSACDSFTTLILPDSLEEIGECAFSGCESLRGVYIPDTVSAIGSHAFDHCLCLEAVAIPSGTKSIGESAFQGCAGLNFIFYGGSHQAWKELYDEYITPFTWVCCLDGDYLHGA